MNEQKSVRLDLEAVWEAEPSGVSESVDVVQTMIRSDSEKEVLTR